MLTFMHSNFKQIFAFLLGASVEELADDYSWKTPQPN
jgi:hypothetical protein